MESKAEEASASEPQQEPERLLDPRQLDELVDLFREVARRAACALPASSPRAVPRGPRGGRRD